VKEKETAATWYEQFSLKIKIGPINIFDKTLLPIWKECCFSLTTGLILACSTPRRHFQNAWSSKNVLLSTYAVLITSALCTIAGVITPIGLYDGLEPSGSKITPFAYTQDSSPFGLATPPRSSLPFSRVCSQLHGFGLQVLRHVLIQIIPSFFLGMG